MTHLTVCIIMRNVPQTFSETLAALCCCQHNNNNNLTNCEPYESHMTVVQLPKPHDSKQQVLCCKLSDHKNTDLAAVFITLLL